MIMMSVKIIQKHWKTHRKRKEKCWLLKRSYRWTDMFSSNMIKISGKRQRETQHVVHICLYAFVIWKCLPREMICCEDIWTYEDINWLLCPGGIVADTWHQTMISRKPVPCDKTCTRVAFNVSCRSPLNEVKSLALGWSRVRRNQLDSIYKLRCSKNPDTFVHHGSSSVFLARCLSVCTQHCAHLCDICGDWLPLGQVSVGQRSPGRLPQPSAWTEVFSPKFGAGVDARSAVSYKIYMG